MPKEDKTVTTVEETDIKCNTPFDNAFRTVTTGPYLEDIIFPLIKEMFGDEYDPATGVKAYNEGETFIVSNNGKHERRIVDACIRILDKVYHLECQSRPDKTMLLRMCEYDYAVAVRDSEVVDEVVTMVFPESGVLYLRSDKNTSKGQWVHIVTPVGDRMYQVHVLEIKNYTLDEIFEKQLYILLPFYSFCFDSELAKRKGKGKVAEELKAHLEELLIRLEEEVAKGKLTPYWHKTLTDVLRDVLDAHLHKYDVLHEEVNEIMGGHPIIYEAREIATKAIEQGRAEGIDIVNALYKQLIDEGRMADVTHAINDPEFRDTLLRELEPSKL